MRKISKGDQIIVIAGKNKGVVAQVLQVVQDGAKAIVEGVNMVKKHVRPNPMKGLQGGIIDKTMPIDISNIAIYNTETKLADRVGFAVVDGKKQRVFKSNGKVVGA